MGSPVKLALIIGINYYGTDGELRGCINDTEQLQTLLVDTLGYSSEHITVLTDATDENKNKSADETTASTHWPSRSNIEKKLRTIAERARRTRASEVFISFSGHGASVRDFSGDEQDGRDEVIVPVDYRESGVIRDDQLSRLWTQFPEGCRVVCLFDCCHSGTMSDLRVVHRCTKHSEKRVRVPIRRRVRVGYRRYRWRTFYAWKTVPAEWRVSRDDDAGDGTGTSIQASILAISGCRDPETSADAYNFSNKAWGGALTDAFVSGIRAVTADDDDDDASASSGRLTCDALLVDLNKRMDARNMSQRPVISSNAPIPESSIFVQRIPKSMMTIPS